MTGIDKDDLVIFSMSNAVDSASKLRMIAKKRQKNKRQIVYVDSNGNDSTVTVYDSFIHVWTSSDSVDKLALNYFSSPSYSAIISAFNDIQDECKIEAGTEIFIPVLEENSRQSRNSIYSLPEKMDCYGIDIALDDEGDFIIENGSIKTTSRQDNLAQALRNRLTTAADSRIRLTAYGIKNNIGDPIAVKSYLNASIQQTVLQEPRVESIVSLNYRGEGDNLNVDIVYRDINGSEGRYTGRI